MRHFVALILSVVCACSGDGEPPTSLAPDVGPPAADGGDTPVDAAIDADAAPVPDVAPAPDAGTPDSGPAPDRWAALRTAMDADPLTDLTLQIATAEGVQFTHSKGTSRPDTVYQIASASKWLSSAVFMSLVEEGLLSLDDHPQDHLPFWTRDPADPRSRITLAQLLAFTSGLPRDEACPRLTTTECAQRIHDAAAGVTREPGTIFAYGGSHMQVAGAMAVAASGGRNWSELFRRYVGDPVGMSAGAGFRDNPMIAGGGTMSVEDYAKFLEAIFARRLVARSLPEMERDQTPLSSVTIAYSPVTASGYDWHYGLGLWRECYDRAWSAACESAQRVSSAGAFGFYPVVERGGSTPYWLIVGREDNGAMSGGASVRYVAALMPHIEAALGIRR